MIRLEPRTTILMGPLLLGLAVAAAGAAVMPEMRDGRSVLIMMAAGAAVGLLIFAPIAAGEAFRARFVWRHFQCFERWSALLGAFGFGGMVFYGRGDLGLGIAILLTVSAVFCRVFLSSMITRRRAM